MSRGLGRLQQRLYDALPEPELRVITYERVFWISPRTGLASPIVSTRRTDPARSLWDLVGADTTASQIRSAQRALQRHPGVIRDAGGHDAPRHPVNGRRVSSYRRALELSWLDHRRELSG